MTLTASLRNKGRNNRREHHESGDTHIVSMNDVGGSNHEELIPSPQVLFMDSEEIPPRPAQVSEAPAPSYYQVATPKSPHDLSLMEDDDQSLDPHHPGLQHPPRESEETERIKYEIAKKEIMEQLNLQILIKHKEMDDLEVEVNQLDAQLEVLEKLHEDKDLLGKVEGYQDRKCEKLKAEYERKKRALEVYPSQHALTAPSSTGGEFYYHTRSKSTHSHTNISCLRPANEETLGIRVLGSKSLPGSTSTSAFNTFQSPDPFGPQHFNQHHRRNYSSNCISSNSGVVGKSENGDAIFRRLDGLLIIITCCKCGKSGFTSAQGIVNHSRLKHSTSYSSQPLAVLNNQHILPDEKQNALVLEKFKELRLDPNKEYLPTSLGSSQRLSSMVSSTGSSVYRRDVSPQAALSSSLSPTSINPPAEQRSTKHLEKMYRKKDFQQIVDYVKDAKNDLDVVLKMHSEINDENDDLEEEDLEDNEGLEDRSITSSRSSRLNSRKDSAQEAGGAQLKSKASANAEKPLKEKLRSSAKRVRPDALSIVGIPDEEKRSNHYNLRAKSKLRSFSRDE